MGIVRFARLRRRVPVTEGLSRNVEDCSYGYIDNRPVR
jgi:hypothetical protein